MCRRLQSPQNKGVGRECFRFSFEDIANGMVEGHGPFSAVICSFALHLLDESYLPALLAVLSNWTSVLIGEKEQKRIRFIKLTCVFFFLSSFKSSQATPF